MSQELELRISRKTLKLLRELPEVIQRQIVPTIQRHAAEMRQGIIRRITAEHTATDSKRTWPFPAYTDRTKEVRREKGLSPAVDYTDGGNLLSSLVSKLMPDRKTGGVRFVIAPSGRHVKSGRAKREEKKRREKMELQVVEAGGMYYRKAFDYTRKGRSVHVPEHWVKLPPVDIAPGTSARNSKSGAWWWAYYRAIYRGAGGKAAAEGAAALKIGKRRGSATEPRIMANRDLAIFLGRRLGDGRIAGHGQRPNPLIQFEPVQLSQLREWIAAEALRQVARDLETP